MMVQIVRIVGIIEMVPMKYDRHAPCEFHSGLSWRHLTGQMECSYFASLKIGIMEDRDDGINGIMGHEGVVIPATYENNHGGIMKIDTISLDSNTEGVCFLPLIPCSGIRMMP